MTKLRTMLAVGTVVVGSSLIFAAPASAAALPGVTPGQCVNGGGDVLYNVGPHGNSDGHGVCRGGQYNGKQLADPSGRPALI